MKERLTKIWKLSAGFDILDTCTGYFMINFDMYVDCVKVIEEDPWIILFHQQPR